MSAMWVVFILICFQGPVPAPVRADDAPFQLGLVPASLLPDEPQGSLLQELLVETPFDWYADLSMVYLDRTLSDISFGMHLGGIQWTGNGSTFLDLNPANNRLISSRDLEPGPQPGLRFLIGRTIWADPCDDRGCVAQPLEMSETMRSLSIELGYLGLLQQHQATARYTARDGSTIISRFAQPLGNDVYVPVVWPFDYANLNTLTYRSRFDSAELNLRYSSLGSRRMPLDALIGLRYMKVQENLDYMAAYTGQPLPGLGDVSPYGVYSTRTDNDMIGVQVGGDLSYRLTSAWSLMGRGRGGLLVNSSSQRSNLSGAMIATAMPFHEAGEASGVGFAGLFEFGIHTNYQLSSNVSLMLGYQGLFLSDLSTAPRQYLWNSYVNGRNQLDRNGNLFFFGPAAGIEWRW